MDGAPQWGGTLPPPWGKPRPRPPRWKKSPGRVARPRHPQGLYFPNLTIMTFDYMQAESDAAAAAKQKAAEAAKPKKLEGF